MKRQLFALVVCLGLPIGAVPALGATKTAPARTTLYHGKTRDGHKVAFRASRTQITAFFMQSRFRCNDGTTFVAHAVVRRARLHRGRFATRFANRTHSLTTVISGTIRGRSAAGRIRRTARFDAHRKLSRTGRLVCTSSTSFRARKV